MNINQIFLGKTLAISLLGMVMALGLAMTAFAGIGISVTPDFPTSVAVGDTNVPVNLNITNNSSTDVSSINLTGIFLTPQCGNFTEPCTSADPGVFAVSATGTGAGACAANTFTITEIDANTGRVEFTPNAPISLAIGATCVINFTVDVLASPTVDAAGVAGIQTVQNSQVNAINPTNGLPGTGTGADITTVVPQGHIIVDKITNPSADPQSFAFTTGGAGYTGFSLTDAATPNDQTLNAGTYSVAETALAGWDSDGGVCVSSNQDAETPASISLQAGETVTCTFTNGKLPTLTLEKIVTNDNGGTATEADFQAYIDAGAVAWNDAQTLSPSTYTASEDVVAGYTAGDWGGDCAANGSVTLAYGDNKLCTITNNDAQASITVIKVVTNDDGGSASPDDFDLTLEGAPTLSGVVVPVNPGTYTAAETLLPGYAFEGFSGDCDTNGDVTVALGESKTCTLTNNDAQAYIVVDKTVINDNGGTAVANDFLLTVDSDAVSDGVAYAVTPGAHTAGETLLPGYTAGAWGGDCDVNAGVTVALGETKTCTITNNDIPPQLHLRKVVINDNGGNATVANFTLTANGAGANDLSGTSPVDSGPSLLADTFALSETSPADYGASAWVCEGGTQDGSNITVGIGQSATCTITNDDILRTGHIIVDKVTNPSADPQSFAFTTTGTDYSGFSLTDVAAPNNQELVAGAYSVAETLPAGWAQTSAVCVSSIEDTETIGNLELDAGETITCTFTNTKLNPDIDIEKATNGMDADTPTGPVVTEGDPINWTYVVTNTGDVALTGIVVTDDQGVTVTCPKDTLAIGESMICTASGIAIEGQYANLGSVDGYYGETLVEDSDPSHYYGEMREVQYCSPGYWKQSQHFQNWSGYDQDQKFSEVFGVNITIKWSAKGKPGNVENPSLLQVLQANGGGVSSLARAAVGALLNAALLDSSLTEAEVISIFQEAYASGDYEAAKAQYTFEENCPLGSDTYTPPTPPQPLLGALSPEDFGVVEYEVSEELGTLAGYSAGFGVSDATLAGATSVVVKLYAAGDVLLQTNTAILPKFNADITGTQFSSPFDVSGSFDYAADGYWTNSRETEYGQSVPAVKVVATVTLANTKVVTATNTTLVGDPTTVYPEVVVGPDWDTTGSYVVAFNYQSSDYPHDMILAQDGLGNLTGSGGNPAGGTHTYGWTIDGGSTIVGNTIHLNTSYILGAVCTMTIDGIIASPAGTISGTWSDNCGGARAGTWATTVGAAVALP